MKINLSCQEIKARTLAFRQQQAISAEAGCNKENIKKNRYKDILPCELTRMESSLPKDSLHS